MRPKNYKTKFDTIVFNNRWRRKKWNRSGEWCIIGIGKRFFSPEAFEYYLNFFGFDLRFWFKREFKK